ncbi:hypothetical protein RM543_03495 [Roseicyclus sp. F158]|uniref:Uncharacterized protein n=1 Tax=Tropicimonas omnivorans TaxID=3075590 RepID=A0ABU3DDF2_9RHOB|nr:hypothetical protein [Roseicyclus sp. F158]MDT0681738.1 hypothetical protein [Roseicyclus sp. F158]
MALALRITVLATLLTGLTADASLAQVFRHCAARDTVVGRLAEKYGESRQTIGLGTGNQVVELYASAETGTWTITVTKPSGETCLMATGQAYEPVAEKLRVVEESDA